MFGNDKDSEYSWGRSSNSLFKNDSAYQQISKAVAIFNSRNSNSDKNKKNA